MKDQRDIEVDPQTAAALQALGSGIGESARATKAALPGLSAFLRPAIATLGQVLLLIAFVSKEVNRNRAELRPTSPANLRVVRP